MKRRGSSCQEAEAHIDAASNTSAIVDAKGIDMLLEQALTAVNNLQESKALGEASLPDVLLAVENSTKAYEAMTEMRNKLVDAYQEIMNIKV